MTDHWAVFVSCEHAGNQLPAPYQALFADAQTLLASHRGYDIGILPLARKLAQELAAPLLATTITRLLLDANRSPRSRTLWSALTRNLPAGERAELLQRYHTPYWDEARATVARLGAAGHRVLHLSVHSFTPVWHGVARNADLGLLYDPARPVERAFCTLLQATLGRLAPGLRVRRNYPYRGNADALVTALRREFDPDAYLGIELEVNQNYPLSDPQSWQTFQDTLLEALRHSLKESGG